MGCNYELWGQTKVSRGKNTDGNQFSNNIWNTIMVGDFLQCWTLDVQGQRTSFYMPIFHLLKELPRPQHFHWQYSQPHIDQRYEKATKFAHVIFQVGCWHMGEQNWHDHAYVNPFLILKASFVLFYKSQRSPLPYVWLLLWNMSLVHILELCLQVASSH